MLAGIACYAQVNCDTLFFSGAESVNDGWNGVNIQTPPNRNSSYIKPDTVTVFAGDTSLFFYAEQQSIDSNQMKMIGGKASIYNRNLQLLIDSIYSFSGYYYLPSGPDYTDVFLMDVECDLQACNDSATARGYAAGPGLQLQLVMGRRIRINTSKYGTQDPTLVSGSSTLPVPVDKWFHLQWDMKLGTGGNGRIVIYVDGIKYIDAFGTNISPTTLPSVKAYNTFEVGVTVNRGNNPVGIYGDNFSVTQCKAFTGTNEINKQPSSFSIYPNPAQSSINILIPKRYMNASLTIDVFNCYGKLVQSEVQQTRIKPTLLTNIAGLSPGLYTVLIHDSTSVHSVKLIIE